MLNEPHGYINIHTHNLERGDGIQLLNTYPLEDISEYSKSGFLSMGIHPWYLEKLDHQLEIFFQKASLPQIKAIGECGLDINSQYPKDIQIQAFIYQVEISEKLHKPLIIHCVKSFYDLIKIRKQQNCKIPWIFHGFVGSNEMIQWIIKDHNYLSFGNHFYSANLKVLNIAREIPLENLFFETDDKKIIVSSLYNQFAKLRSLQEEDLIKKVQQNFASCFNTDIS